MSTYEATQAEQTAEVNDLRAALAAVQAENLTVQVLLAVSLPTGRIYHVRGGACYIMATHSDHGSALTTAVANLRVHMVIDTHAWVRCNRNESFEFGSACVQNAVSEKRVPRSPTPPPAARIEVTAVAAVAPSLELQREMEHRRHSHAHCSAQASLYVGPGSLHAWAAFAKMLDGHRHDSRTTDVRVASLVRPEVICAAPAACFCSHMRAVALACRWRRSQNSWRLRKPLSKTELRSQRQQTDSRKRSARQSSGTPRLRPVCRRNWRPPRQSSAMSRCLMQT